MAGVLSIVCAGLSSLFAGIAALLQFLPMPMISLARFFDRAAVRFSRQARKEPRP